MSEALSRGRWAIALGGAMGLATVVLAALGSHAVPLADGHAERLWQTAAGMLGFHALATLCVGALSPAVPGRAVVLAAAAFAAGSLLFSGTLFLRAAGLERVPGVLAPTGGFLLMLGWAALLLAGLLPARRAGPKA